MMHHRTGHRQMSQSSKSQRRGWRSGKLQTSQTDFDSREDIRTDDKGAYVDLSRGLDIFMGDKAINGY